MTTSRGYTLIEAMICVAILGIVAATAGVTGVDQRDRARVEIQREQATMALEYRASCRARGRAPDAGVEARLAEPLPELAFAETHAGGTTTITMRWRDPMGQTAHRSLIVFVPPTAAR